MTIKEQIFPTKVAEILDIPKEQYDKIKDDDTALKHLRNNSESAIFLQTNKEETKKETLIGKIKNKLRIR